MSFSYDNDDQFPENVTAILIDKVSALDAVQAVVSRPHEYTDPNRSAAVYFTGWMPTDSSVIGSFEPQLGRYHYNVDFLTKSPDEMSARMEHGITSKIIRTMVYRDSELSVALRALNETLDGGVERLKRFGIVDQKSGGRGIEGELVFLSSTQIWVETETTS